MATIKEVAKRAGVSVGTVSNVLNGKTNNEEIIDKVEKAMKELSYRVDATARSMGSTRTKLIGIILPNGLVSEYNFLLNEIEQILAEQGYRLIVQFSQNNGLLEQKCMEVCLEYKISGCILVTEKEPKFTKIADLDVPLVLISRGEITGFQGDIIHVHYGDALEQALEYFRMNSIEQVGFIAGRDFFRNQYVQNLCHRFHAAEEAMRTVEYRKESGFKEAFALVVQKPGIQGIIAGNHEIAMGVQKALEALNRRDIALIAVKESNWMEDAGMFCGQISVSYRQIADTAVKKLLHALEQPSLHECLAESISARFERTGFSIKEAAPQNKTIRFAMLDCPDARSLQMLSKLYTNSTGIAVEFQLMSYGDLENLLYNGTWEELESFHGFMIDIAWLDEIAQRRAIGSWGNYYQEHPEYFRGFLEHVVEDYGISQGQLYGIPFMSGSQFLFYQKDLFTSPALKNQFQRMYGTPLNVPDSWQSLNMAAEFFTRTCNEKSPVKYGITNVRGDNVFFSVSVLNCLLAYQCDLIDSSGRVSINQPNAVKALTNLLKSYEYTSGNQYEDWNRAMTEFMSGDSAMMICFDSHAAEINDVTKSKIAGNVGVAPVPGGTYVQGGWSLALNRTMPEEARDFILWACGDDTALLSALLGGTTLRKKFYEKHDLESMYPWKSMVPDHYRHVYRRFAPGHTAHQGRLNYAISQIMAGEANRALNGEITVEQALENMELEIRRLL